MWSRESHPLPGSPTPAPAPTWRVMSDLIFCMAKRARRDAARLPAPCPSAGFSPSDTGKPYCISRDRTSSAHCMLGLVVRGGPPWLGRSGRGNYNPRRRLPHETRHKPCPGAAGTGLLLARSYTRGAAALRPPPCPSGASSVARAARAVWMARLWDFTDRRKLACILTDWPST